MRRRSSWGGELFRQRLGTKAHKALHGVAALVAGLSAAVGLALLARGKMRRVHVEQHIVRGRAELFHGHRERVQQRLAVHVEQLGRLVLHGHVLHNAAAERVLVLLQVLVRGGRDVPHSPRREKVLLLGQLERNPEAFLVAIGKFMDKVLLRDEEEQHVHSSTGAGLVDGHERRVLLVRRLPAPRVRRRRVQVRGRRGAARQAEPSVVELLEQFLEGPQGEGHSKLPVADSKSPDLAGGLVLLAGAGQRQALRDPLRPRSDGRLGLHDARTVGGAQARARPGHRHAAGHGSYRWCCRRYIAIFHLVTAAEGAEKFYSLENNGIRIESIDQAREIDARTCRAWIGHPKLYVFDNSTTFEGKMQRLVDTAAGLCGIPTTVKASRKYQLAKTPIEIPFHHEDFEVEKVYLKPEAAKTSKDYSFVRCRSQYGIPAYGMTTVRYLDTGDAVHLKRVLSAREYSYAVRHRSDPTRNVIKQQRMCFLYQNQSFQIHVYKEPVELAGLAVLHVQASCENDQDIVMPSFLNIEKELPDTDETMSAYNVSKKELVRGENDSAHV
ncbi:hypothetical protein ON010_g8461 [Phytophthora cinnamomi]|nr:hypothetical protein ON010_g8461 [Phytophthora cinnamomi]